MRNRVARRLIALSTVFALLLVVPASTATAVTTQYDDRVCNMYANSNGFGAYCSNGALHSGDLGPWRERLPLGSPFVPCRDFPVPHGIELPPPPEGKNWVLRLTIVDYDLGSNIGGPNAHLERAIVPVSPQDTREQCPDLDYMDKFWTFFDESYPDPALLVNPTYTPRVNVPAYFDLTPDSSFVKKEEDLTYYGPGEHLTMRGVVSLIHIDPGDGTPAFDCLTGVRPIGQIAYDKAKGPFDQDSTCKHVYKRSSAKEPDGMYTVKLTIYWEVAYWRTGPRTWKTIGTYPVTAVQRLPVQEVQTIGG